LKEEINILTTVVRKASAGDAGSQALLYQRYSKAMFNICIRMAGNRNDPEDILQESFITAFAKLYQLNEAHQFGGWLKRIVVNECIRYSKKYFITAEWDDELYGEMSDEEPEWWKTVNLQVIHVEIKALPDGCRQIFNLYVLENFTHKEIAQTLQISESTSKSQYQRARQLLKERITKQLQLHG
jgi:RNA polymerase sigma-70 factor (ECF subfamily)